MIAVRDLVKVHAPGTAMQVRAIDGLNFDIPAGAFAAIVGESGSGKTTLLTLLGALDVPSSGAITVAGQAIAGGSRKDMAAFRARSVGFIFQGFDLIPTLSARENVSLAARYGGYSDVEGTARAGQLLRDVGLGDRLHHRPGELSGGEQQRVAIARALVNDPEIVLADEPTGELDSKTADQVINLLRRFNRERRVTMIIVTHNAALAKLCDPVLRLQDGRIVG